MNIITNPTDKKKIVDALEEISKSKSRMEAESSLIKEIIDKLFEDFEIPKKILRRMAKVHHEASFTEEVASDDDFQVMYENIINK